MKLVRTKENNPSKRVGIGLKATTRADLAFYMEQVNKSDTEGVQYSVPEIVEQMLIQFMADDKDFQKARKDGEARLKAHLDIAKKDGKDE